MVNQPIPQNHRHIDGGIDPTEMLGDVIPDNADAPGDANQCHCDSNMAHQCCTKRCCEITGVWRCS
jgi:hypothetical protein